jgi:uncharacterized membrane-anchored protein
MRAALLIILLVFATAGVGAVAQTAPQANGGPAQDTAQPTPAGGSLAPKETPAAPDAQPTGQTSEATPAPSDTTPTDSGAPTSRQLRAAQQFYESLHRQTGTVLVAGGKVRLQIPSSHYFVGPEDSRRILVDEWRNPPDAANGIEGMIFPSGGNPATGTWGAVVSYSGDGYVSDQDARTTNYNDLLRRMQDQAERENLERQRQGYPAMTLVGWAEPPHYDPGSHKVYWARELAFSNSRLHTLNYDIRVLGRGGVLSVSFIAGMDQLQEIRSAAAAVMAIPEFTSGNRYADYQQGADPRATSGIAGLIAGGALIAVAQKTGMLAILLLLAKKFIVVILAGLAGIGGFFRRMFGRKGANDAPPRG